MTLHSTTDILRKSAKWIIIAIIALISLTILIRIMLIVRRQLYPPPPVLPNTKFGKITSIPFPDSIVDEHFTYTIDTLTGILPTTFPDRIKLFKIINIPLTLLNSQNATQKVQAIGFSSDTGKQYAEKTVSPIQQQWEIVNNDLYRSITMDIVTYNFKLTSSYKTYPPFLEQNFISDDSRAKDLVYNFLKAMSLFYTDIDIEKTTTQSLMLKNGILIPTKSPSETQVIRINLYQKDIQNDAQSDIKSFPIYYPGFPASTMQLFVMGRAATNDDILEGSYYHQQISQDPADIGEYPLISAAEAFKELEAGHAYITSYSGTTKNIKINEILLGYYLGETAQNYLMPVIVFKGNNDFCAYVSAVKQEWIK